MISSSLSLPKNDLIHALHPSRESGTKKGHWLVRIYRNHSDLISSIGNDVLNTIILVSRVVKQIPNFVNRCAYFAYNLTGMFWVNMQIRDLQKNITDLRFNFRAWDNEGIVTSAAKATVVALNILLSTSLLAAALISLAGQPQVALAMYSIMRPFSLFSFVTNIGCEFYNYMKNEQLASKISSLRFAKEFRELTGDFEAARKAKNVAKFFVYQLYNEQPKGYGYSEKELARHTFKQLSHFQTNAMLQKFQNEYKAYSAQTLLAVLKQDQSKINKLLSDLRKGIQNKNAYTKNNLGLVALGYICMGICKAYPDTLIQSSVTWGISLLYTLKKTKEKFMNKKWTDSLT